MNTEDLILNLIFFVIPVLIGVFVGRAIFIKKRRNPKTGVIVGGLVGLITSYVGLIIFWLVTARWTNYQKYSLYRGGPKRLDVSWTYGFRKADIKLDDYEVGAITSIKEAQEGKTFKLPDGSDLNIKVGKDPVRMNPVPALTLNGKPIPESVDDPAVELKVASNAFIVGGVMNLLAAVLLSNTNPVWYTVFLYIAGVTAPIVGVFVRRMSRTALNIGIVYGVIAVLSFIMGLISSLSGGISSPATADGFGNILGSFGNVGDIVQAVVFVTALQKGFKSMDELEKEGVKSI